MRRQLQANFERASRAASYSVRIALPGMLLAALIQDHEEAIVANKQLESSATDVPLALARVETRGKHPLTVRITDHQRRNSGKTLRVRRRRVSGKIVIGSPRRNRPSHADRQTFPMGPQPGERAA